MSPQIICIIVVLKVLKYFQHYYYTNNLSPQQITLEYVVSFFMTPTYLSILSFLFRGDCSYKTPAGLSFSTSTSAKAVIYCHKSHYSKYTNLSHISEIDSNTDVMPRDIKQISCMKQVVIYLNRNTSLLILRHVP